MKQTVKVLVVLVALSQVECAPPSIFPSHQFSQPDLWPFTNFPGTTSSPSIITLPAETVTVEPIIDSGNPAPVEALPKESAIPSEIIVEDILKVESSPQPQEQVGVVNENVAVVQEVAVEKVTDVPVEAPKTTTPATINFQDSETYRAYEQFLSTWLQQASITLNRPELLTMFASTKQNSVTPTESPTKQSVEKSIEKSVEKVVEQVTVSESVAPQVTPVNVVNEVTEILKKSSGPLKKTPATVVSKSATDVPIVSEPVSSPKIEVPTEPLEVTLTAAEPTPESQILEIVTTPELIASEPIPENTPVLEQIIAEADLAAEKSFLQPEPIPSPEVAAPSVFESRKLDITATPQDKTISEVDLVAEPSFLQPVVVPQPAAEQPHLLAISPDGTIVVARNLPATSSSAQPTLVEAAPLSLVEAAPATGVETALPTLVEVATPTLVKAAPAAVVEAAQPTLVEATSEPAQAFSPHGLTYTLKYFPRRGSSFYYSHALGI